MQIHTHMDSDVHTATIVPMRMATTQKHMSHSCAMANRQMFLGLNHRTENDKMLFYLFFFNQVALEWADRAGCSWLKYSLGKWEKRAEQKGADIRWWQLACDEMSALFSQTSWVFAFSLSVLTRGQPRHLLLRSLCLLPLTLELTDAATRYIFWRDKINKSLALGMK